MQVEVEMDGQWTGSNSVSSLAVDGVVVSGTTAFPCYPTNLNSCGYHDCTGTTFDITSYVSGTTLSAYVTSANKGAGS